MLEIPLEAYTTMLSIEDIELSLHREDVGVSHTHFTDTSLMSFARLAIVDVGIEE